MPTLNEYAEAEPGTIARPFASIDPLPALWTWRNRIPVGELTILGAPGGTGKGMLAADLAAKISTGTPLPDGGPADPPASVIMVSAEDDPNVVMAPRLIAAGADLDMISDLSMIDGAPFTLPEHEGVLREAVGELPGCALVILDPLSGIAPVPLTSVARVRQVLAPLQSIARDTGVSILLTHHVTKIGSLAGSPAVRDAVRSVLMVDRDRSNPSVRCVRVAKSNMGVSDCPVVRYSIAGDDGDARVTYLSEPGKPESGMEAILRWLAEAGGVHSGQEIAAGVRISYATTRVYLARLAARGLVESPRRNAFRAVTQARAEGSAVTNAPGGHIFAVHAV